MWHFLGHIETTSDVHELMGAYLPSAALSAALELGLFWRFADGPQPVESIAKGLDIPVGRCRHWFRLLASLGLHHITSFNPFSTEVGIRSSKSWSPH